MWSRVPWNVIQKENFKIQNHLTATWPTTRRMDGRDTVNCTELNRCSVKYLTKLRIKIICPTQREN